MQNFQKIEYNKSKFVLKAVHKKFFTTDLLPSCKLQ